MHSQPIQPLSDLETLREENERLRKELSYLVTCLFNTQWSDPQDQEYAEGLANYVRRKLGNAQDDLFLEPDPTLD